MINDAKDLTEAVDFIMAILRKQPLKKAAPHWEALAIRLSEWAIELKNTERK
jgi:hypothetical protein